MIEGTRQYKGGKKSGQNVESPQIDAEKETRPENSAQPPAADKVPQEKSSPSSDAVNLERREWFHSLLPAFGDGLVKLLRASNNFQHDLHHSLREKTESFTRTESRDEEK
jgi:hypothetical protein